MMAATRRGPHTGVESLLRETADGATEVPRKHRAYPSGWEPGVRLDGGSGQVTSRGQRSREVSFDTILRDWGLDPADYEVIEPVQMRSWDTILAGEIVTLYYHRANVVRRVEASADIALLYAEMRRVKRKPKVAIDTAERALLVNLSDWQIGKKDGDGLHGTVAAVLDTIGLVEDRVRELRRVGRPVQIIYVAGMGDLFEGCDGHYAMQTFTSQATRREQATIVRRLLRDAISAWSRLVPRVVVTGVAGNHGEHRREGKAFTTFGDNDDVAVIEQVADIFRSNEDAFGHVSFVIPGDQLTIALDICGTVVGFAHGHQFGSAKEYATEWWKGQAMGRMPVGDASVLISGHFHNFRAIEQAGRAWFQCPAMDGGSTWFENKTGQRTEAGTLTLVIDAYGWSDLAILRGDRIGDTEMEEAA